MKRVHVIISGFVQGVGFRGWMKREATRLGVVGWVKNRGDGTVEGVAEGATKGLEALVHRAKTGPATAHVEDVWVEWGEPTGEFIDFLVVY